MLQVGDAAIDFSLPDQNGRTVRLSRLRGQRVLLYFYPKDMTPGCTTQACDLRDYHQDFAAMGITVLGVSRDKVSKHRAFIEANQLPFRLLADEQGTASAAWGVLKNKTSFGRKAMGIERSTFLLDESGRIAWIWRKVSPKQHVHEVLRILQED